MSSTKDKALQLMQESFLCVLSTIGPESTPQAAVVGFSEDTEGNLVIGTSRKSRKYRNIQENPHVALVIGWDARKTIQYEGVAHEALGEEREKYQALHIAKHPQNAKFKDIPDEAYIVIQPTWVRYTDATTDPWSVEIVEENKA